jgi:hypothetical protein
MLKWKTSYKLGNNLSMKILITGLIGGLFGTTNGFSWIDFMRGVCALYFVMDPLWALFWLIVRALKWTLNFVRNNMFCWCCPGIVKESATNDNSTNSDADPIATENVNDNAEDTESSANTVETDAAIETVSLAENSDEEIDAIADNDIPIDEIFTITGRDSTHDTALTRQTASPEMTLVDIDF